METATSFWGRVAKGPDPDACWMWQGARNGPYGQVTVRSSPRLRRPAHHVAYEAAVGPVPPGKLVLRSCGEPLCVRPEHLRLGDQADLDRWSQQRLQEHFWSRVDRSGDGCWLWQGTIGNRGYGRTSYQNRTIGAHRLAWIYARGHIPDGQVVCHRCDNPPCVRPDHLFLGTFADNSADMVRKGRAVNGPKGVTHPFAKFTEDQVREIRRRYASADVSTHQLAREYGVGAMTIWRVATHRSYRSVI
jgi:hypothetical protein